MSQFPNLNDDIGKQLMKGLAIILAVTTTVVILIEYLA